MSFRTRCAATHCCGRHRKRLCYNLYTNLERRRPGPVGDSSGFGLIFYGKETGMTKRNSFSRIVFTVISIILLISMLLGFVIMILPPAG